MDKTEKIFEGPEKKIEIIFNNPLKEIKNDAGISWQEIVSTCGASIIDKKSLDYYDIYLLSESSLFVCEDKAIMITCGSTQLYKAVPLLIKKIGRENIKHFFYERKNFNFPEKQLSDFEQEVIEITPYIDGFSYRVGPSNSEHVHIFSGPGENQAFENDQDITMEILMNKWDCAIYSQKEIKEQIVNLCKINGTVPFIQDHVFDPCGYSFNAILNKNYFTLHVTPQEHNSYVSFETDYKEADYGDIVKNVTNIFCPQNFTVLFICLNKNNINFDTKNIPEYNVFEQSSYKMFNGYEIVFFNFIAK